MRKSDRSSLVKQSKQKISSGRTLEPLEVRRLLAISVGGVFDPGNIPDNHPTSTDFTDAKNGPMANAGTDLINLYLDYRRFTRGGGSTTAYNTNFAKSFIVDHGDVVVTVRGRDGADALTTTLQTAGARIISTSQAYSAITAFVPVGQLRSLAATASVANINAIDRPVFNSQQGIANNQAVEAQLTDKVTSSYGLDGSGVKIGVLSDSVNLFGDGVAGSVASGDLPASGVQIIQDGNPNFGLAGTDEGRAMMELIHDIAPGASFAFATAGLGQQGFADNIRALAAAGCNVIVDDVTYFAEPFFQPGVIDLAIRDFVQSGGTYLSAAGNSAQSGYEAPTRLTKVGNASFVDFDGSGAVDTKMRISVTGGTFTLQWDDPYNGLVGNATSDVDVFFYSPNRPGRLLYQATTNNIKIGLPVEQLLLPPGDYDMSIRVTSTLPGRSMPTRFKIAGPFGLSDVEYGDGTRSATFGHNSGVYTVSVGAVPFFNAPPFNSSNPTDVIDSEAFSSTGPVTQVFDADGNRLAKPVTLSKPDVSGIEGTNTSFFTGSTISPLPFEGDVTQDPDIFPNFFGTSAAAPDVAAVVALIKQAAPNATQEQILNALKATARPTNSAPTGQYDPQGGFGLVDAFAAVQQFVTAPVVGIHKITPSSTTTPPRFIKVVFNQQVSGFDVSDLQLTLDGGPNLLTGNNSPTTSDGGRTWLIRNLSSVTSVPGHYTLSIADVGTSIHNLTGLELESGTSASFTIVAVPTIPKAPTALTADVLNGPAVRLNWSDNSDSESAFIVVRSVDPSFKTGVARFNVPANVTTFTDSHLPLGGGPIYYIVRAVNVNKQSSAQSNRVQVNALSQGEIILDDNSSRGVSVVGDWNSDTNNNPETFVGTDFLDDQNSDKGSKSVTYNPTISNAGEYFIYIRWTRGGDRASNVPVDVTASGKTQTFTINQRKAGGTGWVLLGKFSLSKGTNNSVKIRTDGTDGLVIADAVRFLPADAGLAG